MHIKGYVVKMVLLAVLGNVVLNANNSKHFSSSLNSGERSISNIAEIVFTEGDFYSSQVGSSVNIFADVFNQSINLKAWQLSKDPTEQLIVMFAVPKDFDITKNVEIDVHLFVNSAEKTEGKAAFIVNIEFAPKLGLVGPPFVQSIQSGDLNITPSVGTSLLQIRTTLACALPLLAPESLVILSIQRIAPASHKEYSGKLYMSSMTFRYSHI